MTYISGLYTTNGSSSGDNVDPNLALNNNLDIIDSKLFSGYQVFNGSAAAPAYSGAEIGQSVWPSYQVDVAGAPLYVSDGTNWHVSDQKETWSAWTGIPVTGGSFMLNGSATAMIRNSNLGRVELLCDGVFNVTTVTNKGVWTPYHDPSAAGATVKFPAATYCPVAAYGSPAIFQGACSGNTDGTGHGSMVRWAIDQLNVSGTNYMRLWYCYSDIVTPTIGPPEILLSARYDAGSGYAGVTH